MKAHQILKRMEFAPTDEQQTAVRELVGGEHLVISAYAGASKTTTCILCACAVPDERFLYLAFNSNIAKAASSQFPDNTECRTTHSLAFRAVGMKYTNAGRKLPSRDRRNKRAWEIADILRINGGYTGKTAKLSAEGLAYLARETVIRFCYSADEKIGFRHFPFAASMKEWDETELSEVKALVMHYADLYWQDITSPSGRLDFEHDHYLKMYQLSEPFIDKEVIAIDEGQDTNPATLDIFLRQGEHAQLVMVGDPYQSIYQWRGAIDAMNAWEAGAHAVLSKSFRFGEAVAEQANKWLELLGAPKPLTGFDQIPSVVTDVDEPRAILCRSNAQVIAETLAAQDNDKKVYVQGGTAEIEAFAKGAQDLMHGGSSNHPELIGFKSWDQVQELVVKDKTISKDLKLYVKLIENYGVEKVLAITTTAVKKEEYADVIVSTAHKSKGREYSSVRIASDFQPPEPDEKTGELKLDPAELRLAYVAVTRAQFELDCTALSWVERFLIMHRTKQASESVTPAAA